MFLAPPIILVITSYWSRTASPGRRASCNPRRPMDVSQLDVSQSTDGLRIKPGFARKLSDHSWNVKSNQILEEN